MSRSVSMVPAGTHKGCGGEVRYVYTAGTHYCDKCGKKVLGKDIKKD